jgi:hypothetical protein
MNEVHGSESELKCSLMMGRLKFVGDLSWRGDRKNGELELK